MFLYHVFEIFVSYLPGITTIYFCCDRHISGSLKSTERMKRAVGKNSKVYQVREGFKGPDRIKDFFQVDCNKSKLLIIKFLPIHWSNDPMVAGISVYL